MIINKEIRVVALRRSGSHAIINWILQQSGKNTLFFNDVDPDNPFDKSRLTKSELNMKNSSFIDLLVYSYEDRLLDVIVDKHYYPQNCVKPKYISQRIDVIILRDPFNNFASRLKHSEVSSKQSTYLSGIQVPQLWLTYAHEFIGKTTKLKNIRVCINYNEWCKSVEYRKFIAQSLGLNFSDNGFRSIPFYGKGSSFDFLKYDENAEKMKTDNRWISFSGKNNYQKLFSNQLLIELSESIFDLDNDLKQYVETILRPKAKINNEFIQFFKISVIPKFLAFFRTSRFFRFLYFSLLLKFRQRIFIHQQRKQ